MPTHDTQPSALSRDAEKLIGFGPGKIRGYHFDFAVIDDLLAVEGRGKSTLAIDVAVTLRPRIADVSAETITSLGEG